MWKGSQDDPSPGNRLERLTNACEDKRLKILDLQDQASNLNLKIQEFDGEDFDVKVTNLQQILSHLRSRISQTKKKIDEESGLNELFLDGINGSELFLEDIDHQLILFIGGLQSGQNKIMSLEEKSRHLVTCMEEEVMMTRAEIGSISLNSENNPIYQLCKDKRKILQNLRAKAMESNTVLELLENEHNRILSCPSEGKK